MFYVAVYFRAHQSAQLKMQHRKLPCRRKSTLLLHALPPSPPLHMTIPILIWSLNASVPYNVYCTDNGLSLGPSLSYDLLRQCKHRGVSSSFPQRKSPSTPSGAQLPPQLHPSANPHRATACCLSRPLSCYRALCACLLVRSLPGRRCCPPRQRATRAPRVPARRARRCSSACFG